MRQRIQRAVRRAQATVPFRVLTAFGESQASNYASALAFSGFLAMFPMILGVLAIVGLAVRDPATEVRVQALIVQMFPASAQADLQSALHGVRQSAGWMGLLSIGGLIWSASSIFATMEFALTEIFGTRQRDLFRQKLMGFLMMLLLVAAIVVTVAANAAAGLVAAAAPRVVPLAWIAGLVIGACVMIGLLVLLYRFVPNRTFTLREVVPGALLAGFLIEVLSLAFPVYSRFASGFNSYGAQFGLFFLIATWLYLLSELLLLGAVYNRFRMGNPMKKGLIASPAGESRESKRPVDAINDSKSAAGEPETPPRAGRAERSRRRSRSVIHRAALGLVMAAAVAGGMIGRRPRRKAAP